MKKLLIILTILCLPSPLIAANNARFDFTQGAPTVMEDTTSTCTDTATVRYDFTNGDPTPVFDSTANCTAASGVSPDRNRKLLSI